MQADVWTYSDLIGHALDYSGAATDAQSERFARRAIQNAVNEMQGAKNWAYFYSVGQILTVAPYSTGTITYDHSGGAYDRLVTLASGTWPTWAADGILVIDNVTYQVATRQSGTQITLSDSMNPGDDVAAGTSYTIYRDTYPIPLDCGSVGEVILQGQQAVLQYVPLATLMPNQATNLTQAQPSYYSLIGDPNRFAALSMRFDPAPDAAYNVKFTYRRRPRQLRVDLYDTGTASITNGSTTVTGSGTTWTSNMVGSIIRFSSGSTDVPTGISGASPYVQERSIVGFTSATSMTLDADPQTTLSAVKYSISDPVDIETGAMLTYFLREIERQVRIIRRMKPTQDEEGYYRTAMMAAFEADSRMHGSRARLSVPLWGRRMADMPTGADI